MYTRCLLKHIKVFVCNATSFACVPFSSMTLSHFTCDSLFDLPFSLQLMFNLLQLIRKLNSTQIVLACIPALPMLHLLNVIWHATTALVMALELLQRLIKNVRILKASDVTDIIINHPV